MDKTIRKFNSITGFDEVKAEEYRYWQSRPVHERLAAVSEITQALYAMKARWPMYPDFKELLSVLNECGIKDLVVGAYSFAWAMHRWRWIF